MSSTVTLNPDQEEIRDVARRFLEARYPSERIRELAGTDDGYDAATWKELAELGWTGIALGEEQGGAGYGMAERCLLLEEMGRVLAPDPYLSSAVLAADAVAAADTPAAAELLRAIADGRTLATLVAAGDLLGSGELAGAVTATPAGGGFELRGAGGVTLDAHTADVLVVAARVDGTDEVGLFSVAPGAGVTLEDCRLIDESRRFRRVGFDGATAGRLDGGGDQSPALARALARSAIALSAEMVGGAQRCLEMTVAYAKDRQQFGVPIGSFQAIKHRLADLAVLVDAARESVYFAADIVDAGDEDGLATAAAAAKAAASDAYLHATEETIQLHGGIGFTWEHDAHLFYKRALVTGRMLGVARDHRERVADALGV